MSGLQILTLRTDNGVEYKSNEFLNYCRKNRIKREFTDSYSPQQNGVAERKNRTIVEMARSMLKTKSLANEFCAEAVHTSIYTLNQCPTKALLNLTPKEAWPGYKPSAAHMKVFCCTTYAHVPKEKWKKLDDKSVKCIFNGYNIETRSYKLFDPEAKKVIISKDVVFDEKGVYHPEQVQLELKNDAVIIGDDSNSELVKEDEVKKKPKWLERGHLESNMLDRNFERRVTRSQSYLVNYALMG